MIETGIIQTGLPMGTTASTRQASLNDINLDYQLDTDVFAVRGLSWKAVTSSSTISTGQKSHLKHFTLNYLMSRLDIISQRSFNNHPLSVSTITKINVLSYHSSTEGQLDLDIQHEYHQRPHEPPHIKLIEWFCCSKNVFVFLVGQFKTLFEWDLSWT